MKSLFTYMLMVSSIFFTVNKEKTITKSELNPIAADCTFEGKKLYGKIRLVEYASQADVKVKIVNSFPDLKVKFVENFADDCGEWQIVENGEDLRVFITENFADLKIRPVNSFPGLTN